MAPLDVSRPWETRAVVGMFRFLQRLWRNLIDETDRTRCGSDDEPADDATPRLLHRTIAAVRDDLDRPSASTPPSPKLIKLNNHLTKLRPPPVHRARSPSRWC